jgi:short-subunit dehydrogenase
MKKFDLRGKYIWITGASSGIGASLAKQLNMIGANVIASARREEKLLNLKEACEHPEKMITIPLDITDQISIDNATNKVEKLDGLDMVIHNAGIAQKGLVIENDMEVDRRIMETNYFGTVALTKAIMPIFLKQGRGWFSIVSSFGGVLGLPGRSAYAASKHALHGFFESLRAENMKCKINVSFIIPGFINTNITVKGLNGNGQPCGVLETSHRLGMSADQCALKMIEGFEKRKNKILVGKNEVLLLHIHRISPSLAKYIIRSHPMKKWRKFLTVVKTIMNFIPDLIISIYQLFQKERTPSINSEPLKEYQKKVA